MKKQDLEALGLTNDQIRGVQILHGKDLERERKRMPPTVEHFTSLQNAIKGIVWAMTNVDDLQDVLMVATNRYRRRYFIAEGESRKDAKFPQEGNIIKKEVDANDTVADCPEGEAHDPAGDLRGDDDPDGSDA